MPRCVGATGSPAPAPSGGLTDARATRCPRRGQGANSTSRIGTPPRSLAMRLFERGAELPALSHPPGIADVAPGTRDVGPRAREVVPGARALVPVGRALVPVGRALVPVGRALVPVARGAGSLARGAGPRESGTGPQESETGPRESGAAPRESGAAPRESGAAPRESGAAPRESGAAPRESGAAPRESGAAPRVAAIVSPVNFPELQGPRTSYRRRRRCERGAYGRFPRTLPDTSPSFGALKRPGDEGARPGRADHGRDADRPERRRA